MTSSSPEPNDTNTQLPLPTIAIIGGRVIDPASNTDTIADVFIKNGRIAGITPHSASNANPSSADITIDARDKIVCPGLIDPHVHLREPGNTAAETIESGTRAAAAGGFTTVCCMPNTTPCLDTPELVHHIAETASRTAHARVYAVAAATQGRKGERPAELSLLHKAGAVGFSDDGDAIASAQMQLRVFEIIRAFGGVFMQHCQEPTLTVGSSMHDGHVAARLGLTGWPAIAEELIVERDISLLRWLERGSPPSASKLRYHVQHVSSAGSTELVRRARAEGLNVSAEASPHHLLLTDDAVERGLNHSNNKSSTNNAPHYSTLAKMNPPLREQKDVDALRSAVAEGVITVLATDHAPHTAEAKRQPFEHAPFGIIGLELALPAYAQALVYTGLIDWPKLIELLTINPAKLVGLHTIGLGTIQQDGPADITIIDPAEQWTATTNDLAGKSTNTPFLGRSFTARAIATITAGRLRMERLDNDYRFDLPGLR